MGAMRPSSIGEGRWAGLIEGRAVNASRFGKSYPPPGASLRRIDVQAGGAEPRPDCGGFAPGGAG